MSKQFTKQEWLFWFSKYEKSKHNYKMLKIFWLEYFETKNSKSKNNIKSWFKIKYKKYNLSMNSLESQTRKPPKKGKNVGRKKILKIRKNVDWRSYTPEEKDDLLEILIDHIDNEEVMIKIDKIINKKNLSERKMSETFCISRTTLYKNKIKTKQKIEQEIVNEIGNLDQIIIDSFNENKGIYGRRRLSIYILQKHNIYINERTLGRKMNELGLFFKYKKKF